MNNFLTRLIAQHTGQAEIVQPRLPSRFESAPGNTAPQEIETFTDRRDPEQKDSPVPREEIPKADSGTHREATTPLEKPSRTDEHIPSRAETVAEDPGTDEAIVELPRETVEPEESESPAPSPLVQRATDQVSSDRSAPAVNRSRPPLNVTPRRIDAGRSPVEPTGPVGDEIEVRKDPQAPETPEARPVEFVPPTEMPPTEIPTPSAQVRRGPATSAGPPDISISIGTIDIQAIMPEAVVPRQPTRKRQDPKLSLMDYLKSRDGTSL